MTVATAYECSAKIGGITAGGTVGNAVRAEGVETQVGASGYRTLQVLEDLGVLVAILGWDGGGGSLCGLVQLWEGEECARSVRRWNGAVAIWLRCASVERVDESTVGSCLRLGNAGLASSRGLGCGEGWISRVGGGQSRVVWSVRRVNVITLLVVVGIGRCSHGASDGHAGVDGGRLVG